MPIVRETTEPGLSFHPAARRVLRFGPFRTDLSDGSLWREDEEVRMPPRALAVLLYLLERPGRVVSKPELIDAVWKDANVSETSLTEALGIVRQTLGDSSQQPQYIQTVHRRGYRFIAPVTVDLPSGGPRAIPGAGELLTPPPLPEQRRSRMRSGMIAIAALAIGTVAVGSSWLVGERSASDPVTRATISLPATQAPPFSLSLYPIVALSPDGQEMVYVASSGSANQLFVRRMNQYEARAISGTTGAHAPFFSPDGRRIAFFSGRKLKHVALAGGEPVIVTEANGGLGGTWGPNGTIIFAPDWTGGLLEVDEEGGTPRTLVPPPERGFGYRWPRALADGDTVIATRWRADEQTAAVVAISRATGKETVLVNGASSATYLANRHLVFARSGNLFAASFTPGGRPGPERQVLDGLMTGMTGVAQYAVSETGSLIYVPRDETRQDRRLFEVDLDGKARPLGHEPRAFQEISVCGDRLAVSIVGRAGFDVWIGRVAGGALTQLTHTGSAMDPVWRPGCAELAYSSGNELYLHRADGSAPAVRLQETSFVQGPTSWTPDGKRLVYVEVTPETRFDIWTLTLADRQSELLVTSPAVDGYGRVSPTGRWLAYQSMGPQRYEVFVRPFNATGGRVQISPAGGSEPAWSADGRTLYYLHDRTVFSLDFDPVTGTAGSTPRILFRRPDLSAFTTLPNGHFLVADRIREHLPITTMNLIVNWANEVGGR